MSNRLIMIGVDIALGIDRSLIHPCPYLDVFYENIRIPMNKMIP